MDELMKEFIKENFELYFDMCIVPYIQKHGERLFPDLHKNLCLEHYNFLNKTSYSEGEIELNPEQCWACKQIKENTDNKNL